MTKNAIDIRIKEVSDRKSTRLNSSHLVISYAVFCLKNRSRSEEHTSELQSPCNLACRLLLAKRRPAPFASCRAVPSTNSMLEAHSLQRGSRRREPPTVYRGQVALVPVADFDGFFS